MNSHLIILANRQPMALNEDFSISVEMKNPLFNDTEMFSYPVSVPLDGNRHILKNLDDVNSDIRPVNYEHTPMQIIADGIPFASGTAIMQEDEAIENSLSMNIDASTQSFQDLIGDLQCNEVPIPERYGPKKSDALLIGEKIDEVNVLVNYHTDVVIKYEGKKGDKKIGSVGDYSTSATFSPQALGFSYPAQCVETGSKHKAVVKEIRNYDRNVKLNMPKIATSYINVTDAYPTKPFCNARICYPHHDIEDDGTTSEKIVPVLPDKKDEVMYEDNGPLWVLEADRSQSGICFYLLFFLDCLFEHLGVSFDKSALTNVGDFNRLCFFTTKCAYDTKPLYYGSLYTEQEIEKAIQIVSAPDYKKGSNKTAEITAGKHPGDIKAGFFSKKIDNAKDQSEFDNLFDDVNAWLDSRGCGGNLKLENPKDKTMQEIVYYPAKFGIYQSQDPRFPNSKVNEYKLETVKSVEPETATVGKGGIASITTTSTIKSAEMSASIVRMYANEQNFPKESVSTVIESLEKQFGIKFHYDYEQKKVTAYLIRDVFRKQNPQPRTFHSQSLSMVPVSEKITGVRAGYSAESDAKEQQNNVKNDVHKFNTDYDYIDYRKENTVIDMLYKDIIHRVYNNQKKLFIDQTTGNKYRVKINSEYSDSNSMEPKLFEVAGNKGVEIGDCSPINEEFVIEFISDFVPVGFVDANYRKALAASMEQAFGADSDVQPTTGTNIDGYMFTAINGIHAETIMAAFFEEDMEHEFVKQNIRNPLSSQVADFYVTEELSLRESYNPADTDDGNSPFQSYDWGLSIAIMRGGGVDSSHESYDPNYDGFGNSKWRTTAGKYALTTDSVDAYGNVYDYNGKWPGIGTEERFSLKPRAWVQPEWADQPLVINDPLIKNRGYVDTFLIDYIYFLLHRKKYRVRCLASVAQIADIPNHWHDWWLIDGKKCLINKVNTDISVRNGIGEVELEVYSL